MLSGLSGGLRVLALPLIHLCLILCQTHSAKFPHLLWCLQIPTCLPLPLFHLFCLRFDVPSLVNSLTLPSLCSEFLSLPPICSCISGFIQAEGRGCGSLTDVVSNLTCSVCHPDRVIRPHSPGTLDSPIFLSKCSSLVFPIETQDSAVCLVLRPSNLESSSLSVSLTPTITC